MSICAQTQDPPSIKLIARAQEKQIALRWAITDPILWKQTNKSGFILEKYIAIRKGKRLDKSVKIMTKTLKAEALENWESIATKNDHAAVIVQALYGESFQVEGGGELVSIVNQSQELEQRYAFALLAADMNFEAAQKAAWGFVDTEVYPNEKYVYKIKAIDYDESQLKSSAVVIGLDDYEVLPSPNELGAIFGDRNAIVSWEYEAFKNIYTSYHIERSSDGKNFNRINKQALVNMNDTPESPAKRMFYIDSLPENHQKYYYRVQGVSSFGELSKYSKNVSGVGKPNLLVTPRITNVDFTSEPNEALINWEFPESAENQVRKFQLLRADIDAGPYTTLIDSIATQLRTIKYSDLESTNYLKIKAIGVGHQQYKTSASKLVQPIDSIPPVAPIGLEGKIDTLGIARFHWKKNTEKDLSGYKVFRGFKANEELSPLNNVVILKERFVDTLDVKNLNQKVYYQVIAVDKRFNHSEASELLILEKPDIIPPTPPVFKDFDVQNAKVNFTWVNSSEVGAKQLLFRKEINDESSWKLIYETISDTKFEDMEVVANTTYQYRMKAVDKAGLSSSFTTPITVKVTDNSPNEIIKEINANAYKDNQVIELFWRADHQQVFEYSLYREKNGQPAVMLKTLPANLKTYTDQNVQPNNTYKYFIRATLKDAKFSNMKNVEVKF